MRSQGKLLVLHCPAGGGHKSAARAVAEAAANAGIEADVLDALSFTPRWFGAAYVATHLKSTEHTPALYGLGYAAFNRRDPSARAGENVRAAFDRAIGWRLVEHVRRERPLAVIATHFFAMAVLGQARRRGLLDIPLVGVVTDYTAHAFWAEPGVDRFCAPAGRAPRDLVRNGVAPEAIVATGIPIRRAFGEVAPLVAPRPNDRVRVLITSGGFGVGPMALVLQSFAGTRGRAHLTVVCGDNVERVREAHAVSRALDVDATILGFEPNMASRMAEAHVLVGKPGGLTVSEALAAGRPMVLVGACPGQETANQTWLVDQGAAVVARANDAGAAVLALQERARLAPMAENARDLAAPDAARRVVDVASRLADHGSLRDRGRLVAA